MTADNSELSPITEVPEIRVSAAIDLSLDKIISDLRTMPKTQATDFIRTEIEPALRFSARMLAETERFMMGEITEQVFQHRVKRIVDNASAH